MNQKTINLIITIIFFSLIAGVAFALDYIQLNPQAEAPVSCDASRKGSMYYGFPGNTIHVCDGTQNWSSMGATGNISPLTVTTTDGLLYLNTGLTDHLEGDIYLADQIYGYNDLRLGGDSDFSGETDQFSDLFINAVGDVSIPNGSLTVTDLSDCDQIKTTSGLLDCGTDADTWQQNTDAQEGYVLAGGTNNNKVWKTDNSGNPDWRDDATAGTISGIAGQVAFFNSGTSITSDSNFLWNDTNNKLSLSTGTLSVLGPNSQGVLLEPGTNDTDFSDIAFYNGAFKAGRIDASTLALQSRVAGNVGIGTTGPTAKLSVITSTGNVWTHGDLSGNIGLDIGKDGAGNVGSIKMWSYAAGNYVFLRPSNGNYHIDSTTGQYYYNWDEGVRTTNNGVIHMADEAGNEDIRLSTAGYSWFNGGNVGIGTTGPGKKLEVVGDIISVDGAGSGVDAIAITGSGTGGSIWAADSYNPASPTSGWAEMIRLAQNTGSIILPQGRNFYIGESARFVSDGSYLHYYGPRPFYIRDEVPITYIYSANTYLGSSSGDTIHLRGNIMKGTSWYMESDGLRLGSASSPGSWELYVGGETYVSNYLRADGGLTTDSGDPGTNRLRVGDYGMILGGLHVGGTSDPGTDNLIVDGSAGIGSAPSYKLDVNGTIRARDFTGAGGQNIIVGDDTYLTDIDSANMLGIYGMQNSDRAGIRLGSDGSYIFGDGGRIGIGTKYPRTALDVGSGDIITDGVYYGPHRSGITPGLMLSMKEKILNCVWVVFRCDPPGTSYPSCPSGQVSGDTYGPLYTGRSCSSQGSGTCSGTTYKKTYRSCLRIYAGP